MTRDAFIRSAGLGAVLALLFLGFGTTARSGSDADELVGKLQKRYQGVRDLSVSFTQHVQFGATKAEQTFTGTLQMKKGNKYRIEMEEQTIVTDGVSVWSYNPATKQVLVDHYKEDPRSFSPDKVLVTLPANYSAALLGEEKLEGRTVSVLKLTPRQSRPALQWMKVWVDTDELVMKKIQLLDASDNLMTYRISDVRIDPGIPESRFQFTAPPGVEVIDLR
jgi:outer membrane lipoprotein carrier protein